MPPLPAPLHAPFQRHCVENCRLWVMGALPDGLVLSTQEVQFVGEAHRSRNTQRKYGNRKHLSYFPRYKGESSNRNNRKAERTVSPNTKFFKNMLLQIALDESGLHKL